MIKHFNATQTVHAAATFPVASVFLQALFTRFSAFSHWFRTVLGYLVIRIMHLTQLAVNTRSFYVL